MFKYVRFFPLDETLEQGRYVSRQLNRTVYYDNKLYRLDE